MNGNIKGKLIISANSINNGGGLTLLKSLVQILPADIKTVIYYDARIKGLDITNFIRNVTSVHYVKPRLLDRLFSEFRLKFDAEYDDVILCFCNLPPLFKLKGRVIVLMQNRFLIDDKHIVKTRLLTSIRFLFEKIWLRCTIKNCDEFIVQTGSMKRLIENKYGKKIPVKLMPFSPEPSNDITNNYTKEFDFIYPASGDSHKNHLALIEAWVLLARDGFFPSLRLTVDEKKFSKLVNKIEKVSIEFGLKITNKPIDSRIEIIKAYKKSRALIYPSLVESFGLPLVEAQSLNIPIVASELDYVRDIVIPSQSFDPNSPLSICRAVKRFSGFSYSTHAIENPLDFLNYLLVGKI